MHEKNFSIARNHKNKTVVEKGAEVIFTACGLLAVIAVFSITLYMIISGTPALFKVGILVSSSEVYGSQQRIRLPSASFM